MLIRIWFERFTLLKKRDGDRENYIVNNYEIMRCGNFRRAVMGKPRPGMLQKTNKWYNFTILNCSLTMLSYQQLPNMPAIAGNNINSDISAAANASHRELSRKMPITPKTSDSGRHTIIRNAPSIPIGLPHPGWRTISRTNVPTVTASSLAAIFP
jgi:hypothetical protein